MVHFGKLHKIIVIYCGLILLTMIQEQVKRHLHIIMFEDALSFIGLYVQYFHSKAAVNDFLEKNQFLSIIRGHEAQLEGYKMHKWNGNDQFPAVITIFSAANYCDAYNNKGAIIKFSVISTHLRIIL